MAFSLTWLPKVLRDAGLKVAETQGWENRGRGDVSSIKGVICHHTVGNLHGNMPTLGTLINGRGPPNPLPGPLAQLGLGRDGTYNVVAAGRANHAAGGIWQGISTGNSSFIGFEAENGTNRPKNIDDPWPEVQMDAYKRGVAAILKHIRADAIMCAGHKEYALPQGRKTDPDSFNPRFDMVAFRRDVAAIMAGTAPLPVVIPSVDGKGRPTLRRGAQGDLVKQVQVKLGVIDSGNFDANTEAALRQFQRDNGLVPDGIVGPRTWATLDDPAAATARAGARASGGAPSPSSLQLTPAQHLICERVINAFETGSADGDYGTISIFNDGPHDIAQITYGRSQTTEYGNLRELVDLYVQSGGRFSRDLQPFVAKIGRTALVNDSSFKALLRRAGREDPIMRQTQDIFFDRRYFQPALKWCGDKEFTLPLSALVIYDSFIHSGGILDFLRARFPERSPAQGGNERTWVREYVKVRDNWLRNHHRPGVRASAYRTRDLGHEIARDNWNLALLPINANGVPVDDRGAASVISTAPAAPAAEVRMSMVEEEIPFLGDPDAPDANGLTGAGEAAAVFEPPPSELGQAQPPVANVSAKEFEPPPVGVQGLATPASPYTPFAAQVVRTGFEEIDPDLHQMHRELEASLFSRPVAAAFAAERGPQTAADMIVGVGIGAAHKDFESVGSAGPGAPVINVYVAEPMSMDAAKAAIVDGFGVRALSQDRRPVNVPHSGLIDAYDLRHRERPSPCGISIGHIKVTAGTQGVLARGRSGERQKRLLILSNNHVLANENDAKAGDPILQSGPVDLTPDAANQIAILDRWVELKYGAGEANFVDCATAWCWPDRVRKDFIYRKGGVWDYFNVDAQPVAAMADMLVGKSGRTSQLTSGRIVEVKASITVRYGGGRIANFRDQITIRGNNNVLFSEPGDSGSLIWTWNEKRSPVGLLFAGGNDLTFANKITHVLDALDLELYT